MNADDLYIAARKSILFLLLVILTLIVLFKLRSILMLFLTSFIFAIVLNYYIVKIMERGVSRAIATLITLVVIIGIIAGVLFLIIPQIVNQASNLFMLLPDYINILLTTFVNWSTSNLAIHPQISVSSIVQNELIPILQGFVSNLTKFIPIVLDNIVYTALFFTIIGYTLVNPRPLVSAYLSFFPKHLREKAVQWYKRGEKASIAWVESNVIVGGIQGVSAFIFFSLIHLPGALIFAFFTFIAQAVPKIGPYLMTILPMLVALATNPIDALWILLFYIVINEVTDNTIGNYIRSTKIQINVVFLLFIILAMTILFGFLGTLIATPLAGYIQAFIDIFILEPKKDKDIENKAEYLVNGGS